MYTVFQIQSSVVIAINMDNTIGLESTQFEDIWKLCEK